ncbi:MAG TPA: ribosome-associated translation inhibitor RaiA, partial [bacterium]|nr:ribosome-associated translation inhibitor RaiA [bacterium]
GMRDHIEKRIAKLKRYFDGVLDCHVILRVERFIHKFEITLHGQGFDFFSEGHAEDLYAAFDGAAEKMERQVMRLKDKVRRKRVRRSEGTPVVSQGESGEEELADEV